MACVDAAIEWGETATRQASRFRTSAIPAVPQSPAGREMAGAPKWQRKGAKEVKDEHEGEEDEEGIVDPKEKVKG